MIDEILNIITNFSWLYKDKEVFLEPKNEQLLIKDLKTKKICKFIDLDAGFYFKDLREKSLCLCNGETLVIELKLNQKSNDNTKDTNVSKNEYPLL